MQTIAFYSYKGGAGRTLLLANLARYLAWFGKKIVVMDLDLEAPGLHYKLRLGQQADLEVRLGVLDYIHAFVTTGKRAGTLADYVVPVQVPPGANGRIHLMAAGDVMTSDYWKKLAQINWHELFYCEAPPGVPLFLDLKARIAEEYRPDYLLIDSRTGITEMGGVATTVLPETVVCPLLHNRENLDGSRKVLRSIAHTARERHAKPPGIIPVLSRLPVEENSSEEKEIVEEVRRFLNEDAPDLADTLSIDHLQVLHSDPAMELNEWLLQGGERQDKGAPLLRDYLGLFTRLIPADDSFQDADGRTAPAVRKVFLSSTGADLRDYRGAAYRAIEGLDGWSCIRMEGFSARDQDADSFGRAQVKACDLFVGIIGHRFGASPQGASESYTQREYQAALEAKKPCLLFLAADDFPIPANLQEPMWKIKAQARFRNELRASKDRIVSIGFSSPDDLAKQIVIGIHHWMLEQPGGKKGSRSDNTRYLKALREETAYIDIRVLRVSNESVYRFRIDDLYTPLTTVLASDEREKGKEEVLARQRSVPLQEALRKRCVVLVGDPGAGKSTFLRRIAFAACEVLLGNNPQAASDLLATRPCPLPLLVRAASLADHIRQYKKDGPAAGDSPEWLIHYLGAAAQERNWGLDAGYFRERLTGGCLLLLDGLDEVAGEVERKSLARLLERSARAYEKTQVVATSRPPAYGGETVIPGFATIQIGPLEEAAVEAFVERWCRAVCRGGEKAQERQAELLSAIRSKPEIQAMAVNPVMLTALTALHWNRTRLPDQRSELYGSVLNWLAEAREEKRKELREETAARMPALQCLGMMEHLAFAMHSDLRGRKVEISRHAAARILAPRFRDVAKNQRAAAAERFLEEEETDSGILVSRGDTLRYWHLTFQEYLAARALAARDEDRRKLLFAEQKLYAPEWRETVLLLAGVLCKQGQERVDAFLAEMLDGLGDDASLADRARCVGLIGRVLQDLKSWNYQIADPRYRENLNRVLAIFDATTARTIDFQTRLEAADALGQAGDPRLERDNWVRVEGGSFWMGAQKKDPEGKNYDPEARDDESPVRRVEVPAFWMGRYPVTVFEFGRFLAAGGYGLESFWKAGGYGGGQAQPDNWLQQLRYPNRPVVGVGWYEAAAYCAWAGGRLAKEAEWEYAARGGREGVRYPWGSEEPDEHRANFGDKPGHATPVGLYPEGATPVGIEDMAGNVWEWVEDEWGQQGRVIRGGSWGVAPSRLRVSFRLRDELGLRLVLFGFRCVRESL